MARRDRRGRAAPDFVHRFESPEVLEELLGVAGSTLTPEDVLGRFRSARAEGVEAAEVVEPGTRSRAGSRASPMRPRARAGSGTGAERDRCSGTVAAPGRAWG